ncbi:MAG: PadR family transcriptional regulator [Promethearchaeota archaeon]|nr:MAG: PadR family transcriptional regulator [Candidatus Lokiarchaeota archaeon]
MFWLGKSIEIDPPKGSDDEKKKKVKKLNLSPLEVLILAQLRSREIRNNGTPVGQYGYEMITDLNKLFGGSWEAKSGTIYPILSKLRTNKNMIIDSREKSPLGPVKKVYRLTELGRQSIDQIITSNFEGDLEFILQFLNIIAPFLNKVSAEDTSDELFEKLTTIPARVANISLQKPKTAVDRELQNKKLIALQKSFQLSLRNIEKELHDSA